MGLYALDDNYSLSTWYENNGAYDLNTGTDLLLDQIRHILESDNYTFQAVAFPKGKDIVVNFQQTFSGSLNLVPNSYIFGLNGYNEAEGQFALRIYDKGAQTDLYYGQFALYPTVLGTNQGQFYASGQFITEQTPDIPFGPYFFRAPWIVLPPGILQIQITNVSAPNTPGELPIQHVQLLFLIAVPKTTQTLNTRRVITGSDQTGLGLLNDLESLIGV
jgi:hypothetical protein